MRKLYIVKKTEDFNKIINKGTYKKNQSFIIYYEPNKLKYNRYGISVGKKLGNAVFRNKYKRKIRAIIDNNKKNYINKRDYIIILREGAKQKTFQDLTKEFCSLIEKIERGKSNEQRK